MMQLLLSKQEIITIGIIALVAIAVVILLLVIFVFVPLKYKKMAADVDGKYQYCHSLLVGQDTQYVRRLEIISRTNLLYVDYHTNFSRRFKTIRDNFESITYKVVNDMKDALSDKDYKAFKELHAEAVKKVAEYRKELDLFSSDLADILKPEEEARQSSLECKNKLRSIKQEFYSKENQLTVVAESFNSAFDYIDSLFEQFDNYIESAQYDEANTITPMISKILDELSDGLKELPSLCTLITKIVPDKIHEIENEYQKMSDEHYPINNLYVRQTIDSMNHDLEDFLERAKNFEYDGLLDSLNKIQQKLEEFLKQFDKERESKIFFDENNQIIYKTENDIEIRFIKLRNIIPEVSEIYLINDVHNEKIKELEGDVDKVGSIKRQLDTYIHSTIKQPYSLIVSKMMELDKLSSAIIQKFDEFDAYIESLKVDSEKAFELMSTTYYKVKKAEETVRLMNLPYANKKYNNEIESLYDLLNKINDVLTTQPINVDEVNNLIHQLAESSNRLLDDGEISQDYNMMCLAESAIVYANKNRNNFTEIDQLLSQAEIFFENGDFVKSNEIAKEALNKIKQANGR